MKKLLALTLAVLMLAGMAACAKAPAADTASDLAYIQQKGTLVVGITDFAPMDYQDASGEWIAKPPSVDVVSTVGAGDSMVGGLIYGLLMRESSEHTLRLATAVAALAVSQSNVGITDRPQLAAMMARVDLQPFN